MALRTGIDGAEQDIQAQISAMRDQLDDLVNRGSTAAAHAVRDVRRAASDEVDTIRGQMRDQPVATLVVAGVGALIGFALARLTR